MELADYLEREDVTLAEFGQLIAVVRGLEKAVEESTVARWRDGTLFPSPDNMQHIEMITNGEVTYRDFQRKRKKMRSA